MVALMSKRAGAVRVVEPNNLPTTFSVHGLSLKRSRLSMVKLPSSTIKVKRVVLVLSRTIGALISRFSISCDGVSLSVESVMEAAANAIST